MTALNKQALRERYSPKPVPECHICGKEMTIQRMSASRITYGCTGATYDDKGCHYAEGRSIADDHYEQSRVTVVDVSDPDVLALLDEWEADKEQIKALESRNRRLGGIIDAAEKRVAELESIATDYGLKFQKAQDALKHLALLHKSQMEAAEKLIAELDERLIEYAGIATREARRVAELESRTVNLSKLSVEKVMHMSGFSRDYAEGWCAGNDNAIHEIRTAGIKVKE
ncbi:ead/Ea22-like family protein [Salmonella enterica subsp. enterica]|nr:ead/Ea22-like family protein [Salmonella enterica subsp. enterica serovar Abony]ECZ0087106.1 ead/Ea22-like family protein [Salmonella enterica subsp. enterica serovar Miami]EDD8586492.1 ead/Ea22-like family protein [Salmonella enterica subsp. enterica serovar Abony]EDV0145969.1 ead/Ea22-like family protein [Salmonella enterica subsp. enterica serovar Abony]